jgi:uncharacterized RDD family membrane protein YckC
METAMSDEDYYLQATDEVRNRRGNNALWAKAMAICEGDVSKAKYKYINLRAAQLKNIAEKKEKKTKQDAVKKTPDSQSKQNSSAPVVVNESPKNKIVVKKTPSQSSPPKLSPKVTITTKPVPPYGHVDVHEIANKYRIKVDLVISRIQSGVYKGMEKGGHWFIKEALPNKAPSSMSHSEKKQPKKRTAATTQADDVSLDGFCKITKLSQPEVVKHFNEGNISGKYQGDKLILSTKEAFELAIKQQLPVKKERKISEVTANDNHDVEPQNMKQAPIEDRLDKQDNFVKGDESEKYGSKNYDQYLDETNSTKTTIYAGFWKRLAAYMIDVLIMIVPMFIIGFIVGFFAISSASTEMEMEAFLAGAEGITRIINIIIAWVYFAAMESSSKQGSLGKMALGIKVTDYKGKKISFGKASGRFFSKILSGIIFCIGFLMIGFTSKKQGLHDIMARTLVKAQ